MATSGVVLVSGASTGPFEGLSTQQWRDQFEVNLFGHITATRALLGDLLSNRGRIVNVGSVGGRMALPFLGPYCASKFAVHGWTDALRLELRPHGVHVALVEPGAVRTPLWRKGTEQADAEEAALPPEVRERYAVQTAGVRRAAARSERTAVAPERAAAVIVHALTARRPRGRYLVGPDARVQATLAHLPSAATDRATALLTGTRSAG